VLLLLHALSGAVLPASTPNSNESPAFQRWRPRLRDHIVVIGFGARGRAAVDAMLAQGRRPGDIVVVDTDAAALQTASCRGLLTCHGSATDHRALRQAGIKLAAAVIVSVGLDEAAVSVVRIVRDIADDVKVFVAVHDWEHAQLLRESDANTVVICEEMAGRLLGMSTTNPEIVVLIDDLLTPETGYVIAERTVEPHEVGLAAQHLPDTVIGVVRNGRLTKAHMPAVGSLITGDRVLYVRLRK
jgi:voltage-gated potassium channel